MRTTERNEEITKYLVFMRQAAIEQDTLNTPYENELNNIVAAKEPSYREVLLCIIVQMLLNPSLNASKDWYEFNPRGIYDNGPVKQFLLENGIPHTKSGPLNISKAANINMAWAERRRSPEIANQVFTISSYLETHNSFEEIQTIGISLIKKLLNEAVRVQNLTIEVPPSEDPVFLVYICMQLINNAPDAGNTPQKIAAMLLKSYHISLHTGVTVTGENDRASVTSTTSKKPGDINEEGPGIIYKVYEITVKPFDLNRIIDSYDCITKYNAECIAPIHEIIVLCRPEDCPRLDNLGYSNFYFGRFTYQDVIYYYWNIYEWIVSMLQRMPIEGRLLFFTNLSGYISDINTSEIVKIEWQKIFT
ncbi:hypothetical protein [Lacrimispora sp.]|uniref:hypothetical protein n=1 Tax=Lacrimispora sp. TaxID=2719234 RepID=UPI002896AC6A|nr:hypothetical protein [Lacrimispora sp.]